MSPDPRVLFVQPFGFGDSGGGSRILTSMIKGQPFDKLSFNCNPYRAPTLDWMEERHLPLRPRLGKLDRSRFAHLGYRLEIATRPFFAKKLAREIAQWSPEVVHILPHWSCDFHLAWRLARARGCRVVMSVHDDLRYSLPPSHPFRKEALQTLGEVWREVDHVFVISQEMGEEYSSRYGPRPFEMITDGLESIPNRPAPVTEGRLNIYFMGLFHYNYRENLRALTHALARLKSQQPGLDLRLSLRCGSLEKGLDSAFPANVLPFADQETVLDDMTRADLLYLPLPFGDQFKDFTRYSLSTKMVSYLGSGVPILFHGPDESATARLLTRHRAAFTCHSLKDNELLDCLISSDDSNRQETVENALMLARTSFPLEDLRRKFLRGLIA